MAGELAGRTALVTGGSRGIGREICLQLAAEGAWVAINHSSSAESADKTLSEIRDSGGDGAIYQADVSSWDATSSMFDAIEADRRSAVDLLVTNAGIASFQDNGEMPPELWRKILSVNLDGTFNSVWRAKDAMRESGDGRIVTIASINGIAPSQIRPDRLIAYGTSKSAVIGFTRNCATAFGPEVRVNCVAPGLIHTDMTKDMSSEMRTRIVESTPAKRVGTPKDVAVLVGFLLSDQASFVTGQTYVTSGGLVTLP